MELTNKIGALPSSIVAGIAIVCGGQYDNDKLVNAINSKLGEAEFIKGTRKLGKMNNGKTEASIGTSVAEKWSLSKGVDSMFIEYIQKIEAIEKKFGCHGDLPLPVMFHNWLRKFATVAKAPVETPVESVN